MRHARVRVPLAGVQAEHLGVVRHGLSAAARHELQVGALQVRQHVAVIQIAHRGQVPNGLRQALLVARYDNLGKGASGAAVQNLGLMLGVAVETRLAA